MDIASAKQQIKNTVSIYLQKDALGRYRIPLVRQRPVFLVGAPGIGKTAIMQQIADEMQLGFVSYSMTHHTRQSAIGLPVIVQKEYNGKTCRVSEYTMSEIIASVYDCMERTGRREGILFLDEVNCVSETLSPAMLLFLQYKVFGGHPLPEGWVVVTAGNPPHYNKSAREFDSATRDRLKVLSVEPDRQAWKQYALQHGLSRAVLCFLDLQPDAFYAVENTVDGMSVVTPRAWEDLSECITLYEEQGLPVDECLVSQYLQNKEIARDFSLYYDLYQKYRAAYDVSSILSGAAGPDVREKARDARMDERMSLVGLLLEALFQRMTDCTLRHDALALVRKHLLANKSRWSERGCDADAAFAALRGELESDAQTVPEAQCPALERAAALLQYWRGNLQQDGNAFDALKARYNAETDALKQDVATTQQQIGHALDFLRDTFGQGTELSLAVNDLAVTPQATAFIGQFLSTDFFSASRDLMLNKQQDALLHRIEAEGLV